MAAQVDKRQRIAEELRKDPVRSDRAVAHELGYSPTVVGRVRAALERLGELTAPPARQGRDGRRRKVKPNSTPPPVAAKRGRGRPRKPPPPTITLAGASPEEREILNGIVADEAERSRMTKMSEISDRSWSRRFESVWTVASRNAKDLWLYNSSNKKTFLFDLMDEDKVILKALARKYEAKLKELEADYVLSARPGTI